MHCTVLLPSESDVVNEVQCKQALQRHGGNQSRRGTRKPAQRVLQRNAEGHRDGLREGRDPQVTQGITDDGKFSDLNEWIKSCRHLPKFVRPGQAPKTRIIFATDGYITYKWTKQDTHPGTCAAHRWKRPWVHKMDIKKNGRDPGLGRSLTDSMRGACPGRESFAMGTWRESSAMLFFTREGQGKRKGNAPIVSISDGRTRMKEPCEFLTDVWRSFARSLCLAQPFFLGLKDAAAVPFSREQFFKDAAANLFRPFFFCRCPTLFVQHVAMEGREPLDRNVANNSGGTECSQRKKPVVHAHGVL